jgi:hypothetical protein
LVKLVYILTNKQVAHEAEDHATLLAMSTDDAEPQDEFHFLAQQAESTFSLDAYADFFAAGGPPMWAEQLIASVRGRHLVYRLASGHSNSLLLGWAIKRILADGHDAEVGKTGLSMAAYFGVFHRRASIHLTCIAASFKAL